MLSGASTGTPPARARPQCVHPSGAAALCTPQPRRYLISAFASTFRSPRCGPGSSGGGGLGRGLRQPRLTRLIQHRAPVRRARYQQQQTRRQAPISGAYRLEPPCLRFLHARRGNAESAGGPRLLLAIRQPQQRPSRSIAAITRSISSAGARSSRTLWSRPPVNSLHLPDPMDRLGADVGRTVGLLKLREPPLNPLQHVRLIQRRRVGPPELGSRC